MRPPWTTTSNDGNAVPLKTGARIARYTIGSLPIEAVGFWLCASLTISAAFFFPMRYLAYGAGYVALVLLLANRTFVLHGLARPFVFLVIAGCVLSPAGTVDGAKDIFLIVAGLSISLVLTKVDVNEKTLLWMLFIGLALQTPFRDLRTWQFNPINSSATLEGGASFLFGLLAVQAAVNRRWLRYGICLVGVILTLKRIALLGVLAATVFALLPRRWAMATLRPRVMVPANIALLFATWLYANGSLDKFAVDLFGLAPNHLGMGRQFLYRPIAESIASEPMRFLLIGAGPGRVYSALNPLVFGVPKLNLHSDLLKVLYEFGLGVFCIFISLLYSTKTLGERCLAAFANVLFITDNTLIYQYFIFFLTILGRQMGEQATKVGGMPGSELIQVRHAGVSGSLDGDATTR